MPRRERDWPTIALWLVGATLVYNVVEAAITLTAAALAGSAALVKYGGFTEEEAEEEALLNARCARILHAGDYNYDTQEITLWTP